MSFFSPTTPSLSSHLHPPSLGLCWRTKTSPKVSILQDSVQQHLLSLNSHFIFLAACTFHKRARSAFGPDLIFIVHFHFTSLVHHHSSHHPLEVYNIPAAFDSSNFALLPTSICKCFYVPRFPSFPPTHSSSTLTPLSLSADIVSPQTEHNRPYDY